MGEKELEGGKYKVRGLALVRVLVRVSEGGW